MRAEVVGVLVAIADGVPLALAPGDPPTLPSGPLVGEAPSLQASTRSWIVEQTGREAGYLEQLYTFADAGRVGDEHVVSVSYLGLAAPPADATGWLPWYDAFPWEDHRGDGGGVDELGARLRAWAGADDERASRVAISFGLDDHPWRPDLVLPRYELLYEAGLIPEAPAERRQDELVLGIAMAADHRRILATGLSRLRAKIEYRPVVFELLPQEFTLGALQRCAEAIAGQAVHKQNFRRMVEAQDLVEETGGRTTATGGRPAKLYRFRRSVLLERQATGTKLPIVRAR